MKVACDVETFSAIDLKKVGARRYSEDPSTEVLCLAFCIDNSSIKLWLPGEPIPSELLCAKELWAWNAAFECAIFENVLKLHLPRDRWRCSMSLALSYGLPGDLKRASAAVGIRGKDISGQVVMRKLSQPRKPTKADPSARYTPATHPELFEQLYAYCIADVEAERDVVAKLPRPALPDIEQRIYTIDLIANARGFAVDAASARMVRAMANRHGFKLAQDAERITDGIKVSQVAQLRDWLEARGVPLPDLRGQTVLKALDTPALDADVRTVLEIRKSLSQSSIAKYDALLASECADGRCKGLVQYMGAGRTGRWAGRLFQVQNLIRGCLGKFGPELIELPSILSDPDLLAVLWGDAMTVYSSLFRSCLVAPKGSVLVAADYSGIEARIVAWFSGETWLLDFFRAGGDPYCEMASSIYGRPVTKADTFERYIGKKCVLGAGYQLGSDRFVESCRLDGVTVTHQFAQTAIDAYRAKNAAIKRAWWLLDQAIRKAIRQPGNVIPCRHVAIRCDLVHRWMQMRLPSGRLLSYYKPRIDEEDAIRYMGKSEKGDWAEQYLYGGKVMQHIGEGVARDILRDAIIRLESTKYRFIVSIHDELIAECPLYAAPDLSGFMAHLLVLPDYLADLPIAAEGWTGTRYQKG